ncbi:uncharacterized membrane protein YgdD (TMEM256/DUF423 family) [Mesorhizobium sp. J18]|uniref:DUF423 domain-containing protein n=1 Tax=Mesorhizobium sp. J18 TaxID=935263 RepID=UPI00119B5537|nr:DUF423 domain-containing protein [Mesorhizobium sp. J18]TWH01242.1 uncharacterized membrane protein YgdD (TMEM256/DUF423 family) [Mesorhizobium sp. J18]
MASSPNTASARLLLVAGGLCGAAGVALSAVAAHIGGGNIGTAASFLLVHGPAFLALASLPFSRGTMAGAYSILLGLALFAGDLLSRHYLGGRLLPMAAPAGGLLLIAGWLAIALSALLRPST